MSGDMAEEARQKRRAEIRKILKRYRTNIGSNAEPYIDELERIFGATNSEAKTPYTGTLSEWEAQQP